MMMKKVVHLSDNVNAMLIRTTNEEHSIQSLHSLLLTVVQEHHMEQISVLFIMQSPIMKVKKLLICQTMSLSG